MGMGVRGESMRADVDEVKGRGGFFGGLRVILARIYMFLL